MMRCAPQRAVARACVGSGPRQCISAWPRRMEFGWGDPLMLSIVSPAFSIAASWLAMAPLERSPDDPLSPDIGRDCRHFCPRRLAVESRLSINQGYLRFDRAARDSHSADQDRHAARMDWRKAGHPAGLYRDRARHRFRGVAPAAGSAQWRYPVRGRIGRCKRAAAATLGCDRAQYQEQGQDAGQRRQPHHLPARRRWR